MKVGLQRPYDGSFKALQRSRKYFTLNSNGELDNVCIDCLKPANILDRENFSSSHNTTTHANNSENKQTIASGNSSFQFADTNNTVSRDLYLLRITRKGRVIQKPSSFR